MDPADLVRGWSAGAGGWVGDRCRVRTGKAVSQLASRLSTVSSGRASGSHETATEKRRLAINKAGSSLSHQQILCRIAVALRVVHGAALFAPDVFRRGVALKW
jgi:hypothetical protein